MSCDLVQYGGRMQNRKLFILLIHKFLGTLSQRMSVFKSLKGTFQNVQQDIVDGFRALTSLDSTPRHEKIKHLQAEGISLDAGADLLFRYQKDWSEMQGYTTDSAKKAEEIDSIVGQVFTKYERQWETACRLEEEASTLPAFAATLNDMIELIGSLRQDFEAVEEELDKLVNIYEEEALEHEKKSQVAQLAAYKKKRETEAFSVKGKLWGHLKERAKELETRKHHVMKERQDAFMDAFSSDMEYYRTHGRPDRLPSGAEFPKVSSLSEITLEDDKKALDEFLSTEDDDHAELAEDSFIEDDYTADYSATLEEHPDLDDKGPIDFDDTGIEAGDTNQSEVKSSSPDSRNGSASVDSKNTEQIAEIMAQEKAEKPSLTLSNENSDCCE